MAIRRRTLTLIQLQSHDDGPDLTPYDIARLTRGTYSDERVRRHIQIGLLQCRRVEGRGRTTVHYIAFAEVKRYLLALGFLSDKKSESLSESPHSPLPHTS